MCIRSYFRKIFFQTAGSPPEFSKSSQTYEVTQRVALRAFEDVIGELVLPVPASGEGQEVLARTKQDLRFDPVYKNNFEVIPVKLPQGQTLNIERQYQIKRAPVEVAAGEFLLDDYKTSSTLEKKYLVGNRLINPALPQIKSVALDIRAKQKKLGGALLDVNGYVMRTLRYGNPQNGLYGVEEALRGQKVDCGGYDTLFASVCLALGIPARIVSGFWLGYEKNQMHAWLEVQLPDGRWLPADPSVEVLRRSGRTEKAGGLGYVGSDRVVYSYGCDIKLFDEGDERVEILQVPFVIPKTERVKVGIGNKLESRLV